MKKLNYILLSTLLVLFSGCLNLAVGPNGEIEFKANLPKKVEK